MQTAVSGIQAQLEDALARHPVPGVSMAMLRGQQVTAAAAGITNVTTSVPVTLNTLGHIGSVTKIFTTTLLMQLVDENRVELDQLVARYLPDLRLIDPAALDTLTVRMLLNHTCGIDGVMLPDHGHDAETIEQGIHRFAALPQLHPPGAECSYSNPGMVIAGYLAQQICSKGWYELVRERILTPLDLQRAVVAPEEALLHQTNIGHYIDPQSKKPYRTSKSFLPLSYAPAGTTMMLSATDLISFARAHIALGMGVNGKRILSERSARLMQSISVDNSAKSYAYMNVGLGWMVSKEGLLYHAGGGPGIYCALYVHPQREFAAAILCNADYGTSFELVNELMRPLLSGVGLRQPWDVAGVPEKSAPATFDVRRYVGTYEDIIYRHRVTASDGDLLMSTQAKYQHYDSMPAEPVPPRRLVPMGGDTFLLDTGAESEVSLPQAFRRFSFHGSRSDGLAPYLGSYMHLYRRVAEPA